jgi:hypothetical protein
MRQALVSYLRQEGVTQVLDDDGWRAFRPPEFSADPDAYLLFQDPAWAIPLTHIPGYSDAEGEPPHPRVPL